MCHNKYQMFYIVMDEITKCTFYMCHEPLLANLKKNHITNAGIHFGMLKSAYFLVTMATHYKTCFQMVHPYQCFEVNFRMYLKCGVHAQNDFATLGSAKELRSLLIYFCPTPSETETSNTWERLGTNSKQTTWTNHYDSSIRNRDQQLDHTYYSRSYLLHTSKAGVRLLCAFSTNLSKLCKNGGPKAFC